MSDKKIKSGMSIFYILPKGDFLMFAIVQAAASMAGLKVGNNSLPRASSLIFVEGYLTKSELCQELDLYDTVVDTSKIILHSVPTYHEETKNTPFDPIKPITDGKSVDKLVGWAIEEENPIVIFHDTISLTGGGRLCKIDDFGNLHDRLRRAGATQLYFVRREAEIEKITPRPDLIFNISKVNADEKPTIKVTLNSSLARFQDWIMPTELALNFEENGTWSVEETNSTKMLDEAIKGLGFVGNNRIEIAKKIGTLDASTVGRHLKTMEAKGEVILHGHKILPPK